MKGFDIEKTAKASGNSFTELRKNSKFFFLRYLGKLLIGTTIIHFVLFFLLWKFILKSPLDETLQTYTTTANSQELHYTILLCTLLLSGNYFLAALFREKHDYATINAWYSVIVCYSGFIAYCLLFAGYTTSALATAILGTVATGVTITQIFIHTVKER
ncbi:MAG: hypothetical protein WCP97_10065 [bacterium]